MREIKFRGVRIDKFEWWEGSLISKENGKCYITQDLLTPQERNEKIGYCLAHFSEVVPESVGQFTGSTDKNGKDIFQGDIVKCLDKNGEEYITNIFYQDGCLLIEIHNNSDGDFTSIDSSLINDIEEIEVIGNIFQNPELLK